MLQNIDQGSDFGVMGKIPQNTQHKVHLKNDRNKKKVLYYFASVNQKAKGYYCYIKQGCILVHFGNINHTLQHWKRHIK